MQDLGLGLEPKGTFFENYDPNADASMRNAFATAAYRMGHSLVRNEFILRDAIFRTRGFFERAIPLAEFYNPVFFFREFPASKALDGILAGLVSTPGRAVDRYVDNHNDGVQGWRSGESTASHQCRPGSIPRSGVKCGLSLLVLHSAPRGFLQVLRFPLSSKTTI